MSLKDFDRFIIHKTQSRNYFRSSSYCILAHWSAHVCARFLC